MARTAILWLVVATAALLVTLVPRGAPSAAPGPSAATERPAGTLVFVSDGNRLTAVDVASGRRVSRRIRAVPECGAQLFVTGGHIVFSGVVEGVTTVFSVPLSLDRRPTRLGGAHMFLPSATDGRIWLAGTDCDRVRMVGVREVTVDGETTFSAGGRVPGSYVAGAVPDGLLVHRRHDLLVWDPLTGAVRRSGLEWAFATQGSLAAGCAAGSDCHELAFVDTAAGRTVRVRSHGRHEIDLGVAIASGAAQVAAPARAGRRWSVALIDARSGAHALVAGSRTGRTYPELAWARSSGWLFIRDGRRVLAYRPGAARAMALPFRLPPSAGAFAAA
jgi:hypothetical protein